MTLSFAKRAFALFVYLIILDGVAIFFFTRGFLLTRTELSMFSDCSDISNGSTCIEQTIHCEYKEQNASDLGKDKLASASITEGQGAPDSDEGLQNVVGGVSKQQVNALNEQCWTRPAIKKAIILIIDALRFDFVAHSRNFDGEPKPWMDKLSVLQRLVEEDNSSARVFKFVADPPTTTQQRLKGLTTGGLPTFIDIGHSFGAPAIVEDNLVLQLQRTGKRVVMMGDDTWMQLFPTQFAKAYPFPSFNVKDLHTVDDGVIRELFPSLQQDDWDVLIGHFLGVDHVGHIFGVESPLMVEKLQQYNDVIENVVKLLKNMSEPGGLLEDTLLIVMGDHGQTLNGDHGGGTPEEVETALFAFSMGRSSSSSLSQALESSCDIEDPVIGCINTIPQLDFSATLASFLGVPFPFGSVGQVNAELFDLVSRDPLSSITNSYGNRGSSLSMLKILELYKEVLCINSWQVKRYFAAYSVVAISGFPQQDLARLENLYYTAHNMNTSQTQHLCHLRTMADVETRDIVTPRVIDEARVQVEAYREYLTAAASLARSQWTQFGLEWMVVGLSLLFSSIAVRAAALYRLSQHGPKRWEVAFFPIRPVLINSVGASYPIVMLVVLHPLLTRTPFHSAMIYIQENFSIVILGVTVAASVIAYFISSPRSFSSEEKLKFSYEERMTERRKWATADSVDVRSVAATLFVILHALSLFSNSYIVSEGVVINFLMASSGILYLRYSIRARSKIVQAVCFLGLIWVVPRIHNLTLFKGLKAIESPGFFNSGLDTTALNKPLLLQVMVTCTTAVFPLVVLIWLIRRKLRKSHLYAGRQWSVRNGVSISYVLIGVYWIIMDLTRSDLISIPDDVMRSVRVVLPRIIYVITFMVISASSTMFIHRWMGPGLDFTGRAELLIQSGAGVVAGLSGTIILLMGRRGPLISMLAVLEAWCFLELQVLTSFSTLTQSTSDDKRKGVDSTVPSFGRTADWSLLASQIFFSTGHSCAFDGLHFSAAFIGFDEFGFVQQGILLALETFGASHMLPIFGLPVLVLWGQKLTQFKGPTDDKPVVIELTKGYLWFGIIRAIIATVTTASVCIQRRHLMVWGIFAPKFVFDALGLLVVDVLVILATSMFFLFPRKKGHAS